MARPQGYGSSGTGTGAKTNKKSCMIRFIRERQKWGFVSRSIKNPLYAFHVWQGFCNMPVTN